MIFGDIPKRKYKKIFKKQKRCVFPGCKELVINEHLLKKALCKKHNNPYNKKVKLE